MIMGNWHTKTFESWWLVKLGLRVDNFESDAMKAGTHWEHRVLEHLGVPNMDRQIDVISRHPVFLMCSDYYLNIHIYCAPSLFMTEIAVLNTMSMSRCSEQFFT
jgi:hypothetical protein